MDPNTSINEDIEKVEEIFDGISDKIPQTQPALEIVKNIQLDLHSLKKEVERLNFLKS